MNEEFAISLKTVLDHSSVENVKSQIKNLVSSITQTTSSSGSRAMVQTTKEYSAQLELLQDRINDIQATLSMDNSDGLLSTRQVKELRAELEKLQNKYNQLAGKQEVIVVGTEETKDNSKELVKTGADYLKTLKRTLFAVLGINGVYAGIRKAMSAYLTQNQELQESLNACWYALGSLLAPVLEKMVSIFATLVSWANALARSLGFAGINMSNYGKAAAKATKQTAGFDEINNVSNSGNGVNVPDLGLDKNYTDTQITNMQALAASIFGVVAAITALGAGLGLIKSMGIGILAFGIVFAIESLLAYLQDPTWNNFGNFITGIGIVLLGLGVITGGLPFIIAGTITVVAGLLASHWEEVKAFFEKIEKALDTAMQWVHKNITSNFGIFGALIGSWMENTINNVKTLVTTVKTLLDGLFNGVKLILDGIIKIFKGDFKNGISDILNGIFTIIKSVITSIANFLSSRLNNIVNLVGNILTAIGNKVSTKVKDIINKYIINPINRVINWINEKLHFSFGGLNKLGVQIIPAFSVQLAHLNTLPQLNVGTNYVPNDMVAQLHQGEAVVPKEFNSKEFFGNSDETNGLLRQLIDIVDTKEFRTYISQKDIGKAAVNYINNKSRVMGGSLV